MIGIDAHILLKLVPVVIIICIAFVLFDNKKD